MDISEQTNRRLRRGEQIGFRKTFWSFMGAGTLVLALAAWGGNKLGWW